MTSEETMESLVAKNMDASFCRGVRFARRVIECLRIEHERNNPVLMAEYIKALRDADALIETQVQDVLFEFEQHNKAMGYTTENRGPENNEQTD